MIQGERVSNSVEYEGFLKSQFANIVNESAQLSSFAESLGLRGQIGFSMDHQALYERSVLAGATVAFLARVERYGRNSGEVYDKTRSLDPIDTRINEAAAFFKTGKLSESQAGRILRAMAVGVNNYMDGVDKDIDRYSSTR